MEPSEYNKNAIFGFLVDISIFLDSIAEEGTFYGPFQKFGPYES